MKVSELIKKLNLDLLTDKDFEDRDVLGCYIGDLLSHVMGKACEGDAWITIMNNINIRLKMIIIMNNTNNNNNHRCRHRNIHLNNSLMNVSVRLRNQR